MDSSQKPRRRRKRWDEEPDREGNGIFVGLRDPRVCALLAWGVILVFSPVLGSFEKRPGFSGFFYNLSRRLVCILLGPDLDHRKGRSDTLIGRPPPRPGFQPLAPRVDAPTAAGYRHRRREGKKSKVPSLKVGRNMPLPSGSACDCGSLLARPW